MTGRHARLSLRASRWGSTARAIGRAARRPGRARWAAAAVLAVICAAGALPLLLPSGSPARASSAGPEPLRVMIEGDSITQGFSGDTTWRYWLAQEFGRQGVPVDFVGPIQGTAVSPANPTGGRYTRPFDSDHRARAGSQLISRVHLGSITERMETYRPDVVVMLIGFNDLNRGGRTAGEVARGVEKFVTRVHRVSPRTKVVLGKVMDAVKRSGAPRLMPNEALNRKLTRIASNRPLVTLASTSAGWKPLKWTTDGIHPNPTGETVLAQRFAMALHRARVLPHRSDLIRSLRWRPGVEAELTGLRRGFRLAWPGQKKEWRVSRFRVDYQRIGGTARGSVTTRNNWLVVRGLTPGRYRVRTTPERVWMEGQPTVRRVRVLR